MTRRDETGPAPERRERLLILGAAGRDFHDFNVVFRSDPYIPFQYPGQRALPKINGQQAQA